MTQPTHAPLKADLYLTHGTVDLLLGSLIIYQGGALIRPISAHAAMRECAATASRLVDAANVIYANIHGLHAPLCLDDLAWARTFLRFAVMEIDGGHALATPAHQPAIRAALMTTLDAFTAAHLDALRMMENYGPQEPDLRESYETRIRA